MIFKDINKKRIWLENFLRERINKKIYLGLINNYWIIKLTGSKKYIKFRINPEFYKLGKNNNLEFQSIKVDRFLYNSKKLELPVAYKKQESGFFIFEEDGYLINSDIIGLFYRILSRSEEVNPSNEDIDKHKRFKGKSSEAFKNNFLDIPIVDLWLDVLSNIAKNLWQIDVNKSKFHIYPTHDVDRPSLYLYSKRKLLIKLLIYIYKNDINSFFKLIPNYIKASRNLDKEDPYNTFDWLINQSNKNKLQSCFYFMAGNTSIEYDPGYDIRLSSLKRLIKKIDNNGHLIGLHPSYNTYLNHKRLNNEYQNLRELLYSLNIKNFAGTRMHYLRYSIPETPQILENIGVLVDSSLYFADVPGFRCGTSHDYQMFDPVNQVPLNLRQKPIIAMENSILPGIYSNLGLEDAKLTFKDLIQKCKNHNGNFTLLWHNNEFMENINKEIYKEIISESS